MNLPAQFGKYELVEHLATGGMAEVFVARSFGAEGFERQLVIKRILPGLSHNPHFVSMFVKEAKISAGLSHPNIVQIFELGKVSDDHYIAMELIDGLDLTRLMRRLRDAERPLPVALALYIAASLLRGLGHAHAATDATGRLLNLVHRDVSPHNVLVSYQGEVKLFDFGIARLVGEAEGGSGGRPGGGKFGYMSPEQARGEGLDHRSDLYSVGVVLYELLTGRRPHAGLDAEERLKRVQAGVLPDLAGVAARAPGGLVGVLRRLLAADRADRPARAEEVEEELWATLFAMGERADAATLRAFLKEVCAEAPARSRGMVDLAGLSRDLERLGTARTATPSETFAPSCPPGRARSLEGLHPGERKQVVVLVAETVGLTDLSARFDPERVVRGHLRFLRRARRAVDRHGGLLDSWQDDTLVVLFGVPRTMESDLDRALACAMELGRIARSMERHGLRMDLCTGVHRGAISVGAQSGRSLRWLAVGDTLKLARRLCYAANLGETLVSHGVARAGEHHWRFSEGPTLAAKGNRRAPVTARLMGRRRRADGRRGPWLPRGGEFDTLRRALGRLSDGSGGLLQVTGPAGTGKSRWVREVRALARARGVAAFVGRALPQGGHGPAGFFKDLLADVLGIEGTEDAAALRGRLDRLAQLGLDAEARSLVRALFAVDWAERRPQRRAGSVARVARAVVRGLCAAHPVILAIEDTQHLSETERSILAELVAEGDERPVLFILTGRRGDASPRAADWRVALAPLAAEQQTRLVIEMLPDELAGAERLAPSLAELLARRTDGNPLYLETLLDALIGDGRLGVEGGELVLLGGDAEVQLPPGLGGLIAARIDALPPAVRTALELAAVLGATVDSALLTAVLGGEDGYPLIESLVEHGLLSRTGEASAGHLQFSNLFVWESVKQATADARRRRLHERVADGIERRHAGSLDAARELLAHHWAGAARFESAALHIARAGDLYRGKQLFAEAGGCWDRAVGWLGAARSAGQPLDLRLADEAELRVKAGEAWHLAGSPQRAEMHLQVALELAEEGGGPRAEAQAQAELGRLYRSQGRMQLARVHLELACETASALLEREPWARGVAVGALEGLGMVCYDCGENDAAEDAFSRALELAGGDLQLHAKALHGLAIRRVRGGQEAEALGLLTEARDRAMEAGDRILLGRIVNNTGIVHHGAGRYGEALECFRESLDVREGLGYRRGVAINLHNIGDAHLRMGDRGRAWAAFRRSRELAESGRWERGVVMNEVFLAWLEFDADEAQAGGGEGIARIRTATERARQLSDPETALTGSWLLGRALAAGGEPARARTVLQEALDEAEDLDARLLIRELTASLRACSAPAKMS